MDDGLCPGNKRGERLGIGDVAFNELFDKWRDVIALAGRADERADVMAGGMERFGGVTADESGCAGDGYLHDPMIGEEWAFGRTTTRGSSSVPRCSCDRSLRPTSGRRLILRRLGCCRLGLNDHRANRCRCRRGDGHGRVGEVFVGLFDVDVIHLGSVDLIAHQVVDDGVGREIEADDERAEHGDDKINPERQQARRRASDPTAG